MPCYNKCCTCFSNKTEAVDVHRGHRADHVQAMVEPLLQSLQY